MDVHGTRRDIKEKSDEGDPIDTLPPTSPAGSLNSDDSGYSNERLSELRSLDGGLWSVTGSPQLGAQALVDEVYKLENRLKHGHVPGSHAAFPCYHDKSNTKDLIVAALWVRERANLFTKYVDDVHRAVDDESNSEALSFRVKKIRRAVGLTEPSTVNLHIGYPPVHDRGLFSAAYKPENLGVENFHNEVLTLENNLKMSNIENPEHVTKGVHLVMLFVRERVNALTAYVECVHRIVDGRTAGTSHNSDYTQLKQLRAAHAAGGVVEAGTSEPSHEAGKKKKRRVE